MFMAKEMIAVMSRCIKTKNCSACASIRIMVKIGKPLGLSRYKKERTNVKKDMLISLKELLLWDILRGSVLQNSRLRRNCQNIQIFA